MGTKGPKPSTREVYAICDVERNACKIGFSSDFENRLRTFHTASSRDFTVAHREQVDYSLAPKIERGARKLLVEQGRSKVREWVKNCSPEDARDAIIISHQNIRGKNNNGSEK